MFCIGRVRAVLSSKARLLTCRFHSISSGGKMRKLMILSPVPHGGASWPPPLLRPKVMMMMSTSSSSPDLNRGENIHGTDHKDDDKTSSKLQYSDSLPKVLVTILKKTWASSHTEERAALWTALGSLLGVKVYNAHLPYFSGLVIDWINTSASYTPVGSHGFTTLACASLGHNITLAGAFFFRRFRNHSVSSRVTTGRIWMTSAIEIYRLHGLDLQYHLRQDTGALKLFVNRGRRALNFILSSMVFHVAPALVEIPVVLAILTFNFSSSFALTASLAAAGYGILTIFFPKMTIEQRESLNESVIEDSTRVPLMWIGHELWFQGFVDPDEDVQADFSKRYENALQKEGPSVLDLLLLGAALNAVLKLSVDGIQSGQMSIGDLVMVYGLLFQLSQSVYFLGKVYRQVVLSVVDVKSMFRLLEERANTKVIKGCLRPLWHHHVI